MRFFLEKRSKLSFMILNLMKMSLELADVDIEERTRKLIFTQQIQFKFTIFTSYNRISKQI